MTPVLRPLAASDGPSAAQIYFDAVHVGAAPYYTADQRLAWGGSEPQPDRWTKVLASKTGLMAMVNETAAGFMTLEPDGYIDFAFVDPACARRGVGSALMAGIVKMAQAAGVDRLTTEASKAARPFFAHHGFSLIDEQQIERQGETLTNYQMARVLA